MQDEWLMGLIGGIIIGLSVTIMLLFNGRVTGIAGIIYGLFKPSPGDFIWRIYFLVGLVLGGLVMTAFKEDAFLNKIDLSWAQSIGAGLLVGFGTVLGSGCTSGHGVCGLSRLSPRSLVATLVFMASGIMTVYILRKIGVLP
ncbi:MAG: YeeE/YedE family protein [Bdellovibrionaceae bacterium]|nr:YeeE/YedE family protein [Pseudobdellovibrionaceae bacterium]MDW8190498.1 YeeE/YedE family protein [Pseudobdellovibrionaceae bacterium]